MSLPVIESISERLETTSVSNTTITKPSGTVDGDLLLMFCNKGNASGTDTLPAGWNLIFTRASSAGRSHVLWKIASSEPADYNISTSSGNGRWVTHILRISGADATTPIHADSGLAASNNVSRGSPTPVAATRADVLAINGFFIASNATAPHENQSPFGSTELWNVNTDSNSLGRGGMGIAFYPMRTGFIPGGGMGVDVSAPMFVSVILINPADGRVTDNIEGDVTLGEYPVVGAEVSITARLLAPIGPLSVVGDPVHIATVESDEYGHYEQEVDVISGVAYDAYCRHSDSLGAYNTPSQWSE